MESIALDYARLLPENQRHATKLPATHTANKTVHGRQTGIIQLRDRSSLEAGGGPDAECPIVVFRL